MPAATKVQTLTFWLFAGFSPEVTWSVLVFQRWTLVFQRWTSIGRGVIHKKQFNVLITGRGGPSNASTAGAWLHVFTLWQNLRDLSTGLPMVPEHAAYKALRSVDVWCLDLMHEMRGGVTSRAQGEDRKCGALSIGLLRSRLPPWTILVQSKVFGQLIWLFPQCNFTAIKDSNNMNPSGGGKKTQKSS